jgi:hypothetical protein
MAMVIKDLEISTIDDVKNRTGQQREEERKQKKDAQRCPNMVTRLAGMTYIMGDTILT